METSACLLITSHQADSDAVNRLSRLLAGRGIAVCSLAEAGPAAWTQARAMAVCLGPHGLDQRQKRDIGQALAWQTENERAGHLFPIVPILLPEAGLAPAFLLRHAWVDLSHDLADPDRLGCLVEAATRGVAPLRPIATLIDFCPYPGPHPFREEDAAFFYGRETVIERLLAEVTSRNLVALIGPPAGGKTSLLNAGLVPRLRRQNCPSIINQPKIQTRHKSSQKSARDQRNEIANPKWAILSFTPADQPCYRLAAALTDLLERDASPAERFPAIRQLGDQLARDNTRLEQVVQQILTETGAERLLLLVDQFEELLSLTPEAERHPFVEMLLRILAQPDVTLVLSLRADFYSEVIRLSPELSVLLEQRVVNLGPLSRAELERAITKPARPVTLAFEPDLVERLTADVAGAPDQLLLLQVVLVELWRQHQGGLLRHAFYERIGQVQGAITYGTEQVFQTLTPAQQGLARRVLARLVEVRPDGSLICQPVGLSQFASTLEGEENESLRVVVKALAEAQLLTFGYDPVTGKPVVEAAHEVLARRWPRWQAWLNEDREFWLWRQRLREFMTGWERANPKKGQLLKGTALLEAERWLMQRRERLDSAGRVYIWQSLAHWNWERDVRWLISLGAVFLLIVGLVILLTEQNAILATLRQERNGALAAQALAVATRQAAEIAHAATETQRQKVEQQQQATLSRLLAAQAQILLTGELGPSTLLAIESLRRAPNVDGERVLHHNLALLPRPVAQIRAEMGVNTLAFNADGRRLVTTSGQGAPRLWETSSGREITEAGQRNGITAATLNLQQGGQLVEPASTGGQLRAPIAALSPDGRWLASGHWDGTVRVWNVASGWQVAQLALNDNITTLSFGPTPQDESGGQWLAAGGWNGRVRLWLLVIDPVIEHAGGASIPEHPPLKPERTVTVYAHRDVVLALTFSPDGQRLATASADNSAKVWDLSAVLNKTGLIPPALGGGVHEVARLGHGAGVWSVAFNPNGRWLATGSADRTARLWDISTGSGREIGRQIHRDDVKTVLFSPNGLWLATVDSDHAAYVWLATSASGGEPASWRKVAQMNHAGHINSLTFSPDSRWLATTSADHTARVWETATGREVAQMSHDDDVTAVAFSRALIGPAERQWIATASGDGLTRIWEITPGQEVTQLPQPDWVLGLQFSPDNDWLAVYSREIVRIWAVKSSQLATEMGHDDWIISASFSPDGYWLATGSRDKTARMWQIPAGQEVGLMKHPGPVHLVMFSPTGRQLATASSDNIVRLWQTGTTLQTGTAVGPRVIQLPHSRWVNAVAFSPDGRWLATASRDYKARIWETHTGRELSQLNHMDGVIDVAFSPDGRWLATASADHTARLWDVATNREVTRLPHERRVEAVLFSSDGRWLATRSGNEVSVWEVAQVLTTRIATEQQVARLRHEESVRAMAFSPDGRWLATATGNPPGTGAARLWETATGQEITGMAYDNWVYAVAFSPDGRWLVHGGGDRLAQIWLLQPQDLIDEACARLTRNLTRLEWRQYLGEEPYRPTCSNLPVPQE